MAAHPVCVCLRVTYYPIGRGIPAMIAGKGGPAETKVPPLKKNLSSVSRLDLCSHSGEGAPEFDSYPQTFHFLNIIHRNNAVCRGF